MDKYFPILAVGILTILVVGLKEPIYQALHWVWVRLGLGKDG